MKLNNFLLDNVQQFSLQIQLKSLLEGKSLRDVNYVGVTARY